MMPSIDPDSQRMIDTEKDTLRRLCAETTSEAELWFASLHALEDFMHREGRFPSRLAKDTFKAHLAAWLAHEDTATRTRTSFQIVRLIPFFLTPDVLVGDQWIAFAALERFVLAKRRLPLISSIDEEEREFAEWVRVTRRRGFRQGIDLEFALATIFEYVETIPSRTRHPLRDAA